MSAALMLRNCAYWCAVLRADLAAVKEHAAVSNSNEAALQSKIQQSNESLAVSERSLLDLNAQLAEKAEQISALERELDSEKHAAITLKTAVDTEKLNCSALQKSHAEVMIAARLEAVEKSEKIMVLERELDCEKQAAIGLRALVDSEKQKCSVLQKSHEEAKGSLEREMEQERAATKEEKGQLLAAVIQLQDTVELYERRLESEAEAQNAQVLNSVAARLEAEGREASLQEHLRQATQAANSRERVLEELAEKNCILQTEYDLLHESQEALRKEVSALREEVEHRDGTVQSLQLEAADLQGKLTQAKTLAAFLKSELKAECEGIGALQKEFDDSKTLADEQAATADRMLELEKEKTRAHCNMLQHESTLTKTQLTFLQTELGAKCESIRNLQTELDAFKMQSDEKSAALHMELEAERNKARALQLDFDAAKAQWGRAAEKMSTELEIAREKTQVLQEAKAYAQSRSNMQSKFDNINLDTAGVVPSEAPDPGQAAAVEQETKGDETVITDISAPAEVYIVLDMELPEIKGKVCLFASLPVRVRRFDGKCASLQEEDFRREMIANVAAAVDGDSDKIKIHGIEAGSIVVKMSLHPGVLTRQIFPSTNTTQLCSSCSLPHVCCMRAWLRVCKRVQGVCGVDKDLQAVVHQLQQQVNFNAIVHIFGALEFTSSLIFHTS